MKAPGTFAFLLRWHFLSFVGGLVIAGVAAFLLLTYKPPKPSAMDAVFTSPGMEFSHPLMWILLATGVLIALNAWRRAWADAHP